MAIILSTSNVGQEIEITNINHRKCGYLDKL